MNFNDLVKNNKQINFIREAYTGQFTIGFELEGICTWKKDSSKERFYLPDYGDYSKFNKPKGGAKLLKKYLDDLFNITGSSGDSKIESDSSLNTKGFGIESGVLSAWNFEYATNKIPFNPQNIEKIYKSLIQLNDKGIYTNDSCGFHIHMSFPEIDKKIVAWILCCIAIDKQLIEDMLYLDTDDEGGELYLFDSKVDESGNEIDGYATIDFLNKLSFAIKENDYKKIDNILRNDKYRVLHIHDENGTIEWRGPRGFLNYDDDKIIKAFILKWFKLVSKIAKMTQSLTYSSDGITINKEELLSHLSLKNFELNSPAEKNKRLKSKNLLNIVEEAPVKLFSLTPKAIQKMYDYNATKTVQIIYEIATNDMFGEEWARLKNDLFNIIFEKYMEYFSSKPEEILRFCEILWYPLINNNTSLIQKLNEKNKEIILTIISDAILTENLSDEVFEMAEDLNIFNSKIFQEKLKKKFQSNEIINFHTILDVSTNLPSYIWNILMNNRYIHFVSLIEMVPEKYQIRMVQKDPYNIQYINNPSEKVIKMAKEKIPNVKSFIRGE